VYIFLLPAFCSIVIVCGCPCCVGIVWLIFMSWIVRNLYSFPPIEGQRRQRQQGVRHVDEPDASTNRKG
jgi:hypothetical protein